MYMWLVQHLRAYQEPILLRHTTQGRHVQPYTCFTMFDNECEMSSYIIILDSSRMRPCE